MSLNIILYFIIKLLWIFIEKKKILWPIFHKNSIKETFKFPYWKNIAHHWLNIHLSSAYIIKYNSNIAANLPAQCKWKVSKRKITLNFSKYKVFAQCALRKNAINYIQWMYLLVYICKLFELLFVKSKFYRTIIDFFFPDSSNFGTM